MINSIEATITNIDSSRVKLEGSGILIDIDKKYLPKEVKIGQKFFLNIAPFELDQKNKADLAKEILNQILKK